MNYDLIDLLAHLLIAAGTIGTLLLFKDMRRSAMPQGNEAALNTAPPPDYAHLDKKLNKILSRIGNVKTRLADEERQDQREKVHERYIRHRDEQKGGE